MELDVTHAIVLGLGEGEVITERPERTLHLKVGIDAIAVTETRYEPGERGPDAHVHHRHADAFYVVEGTMLYELGSDGEAVQAPAGAFIAAPPDVAHSFRNEGPGRARFLNFHAPSGGFHDYLRASYAGEDTSWFDQHDPPADGGRPFSDAVVRRPGEGERTEVAGMLAFAEATITPGSDGARRVLDDAHEVLYVLAGTLTLCVGDHELDVVPGSFVCVPPSVARAWANRGEEPARILALTAPSG
jgi:mannose-6-phosphate isomerase-like protein (cupin superfamily)